MAYLGSAAKTLLHAQCRGKVASTGKRGFQGTVQLLTAHFK